MNRALPQPLGSATAISGVIAWPLPKRPAPLPPTETPETHLPRFVADHAEDFSALEGLVDFIVLGAMRVLAVAVFAVAVILAMAVLSGCGGGDPQPTVLATDMPTPPTGCQVQPRPAACL